MSRTHVLVLVAALTLFFYVLDLVRRRRLPEEYSWLWLLLALACVVIAALPELAAWLAQLLGSKNPLSALVFPALYFLFLILIQLSTRISRIAAQNKNLAQLVAILDGELRGLLGVTTEDRDSSTPANEGSGAQRADRGS